ncbi:hypothetical protein BX070DRAFT_249847 [Coemansia spiralis]|nr:hypothetical protein BX070DRAFT_249847 [Coemansia spiralis]KAJ1994799.1 hypothetical protein EDC05_001422 [Coemansia umbellata]
MSPNTARLSQQQPDNAPTKPNRDWPLVLTTNYLWFLRPLFSRLDDPAHHLYRASGSHGRKWPSATPIPGALRIQLFAAVCLGGSLDYYFPMENTWGAPRFRTQSCFQGLCSNILVEISVCNDGKYRNSLVGCVLVPVKALYGVCDYYGWLVLECGRKPAGFVYLGSCFRSSNDAKHHVLERACKYALRSSDDQHRRLLQKRYQERIEVRTHKFKKFS